jgi:hypothetical protein
MHPFAAATPKRLQPDGRSSQSGRHLPARASCDKFVRAFRARAIHRGAMGPARFQGRVCPLSHSAARSFLRTQPAGPPTTRCRERPPAPSRAGALCGRCRFNFTTIPQAPSGCLALGGQPASFSLLNPRGRCGPLTPPRRPIADDRLVPIGGGRLGRRACRNRLVSGSLRLAPGGVVGPFGPPRATGSQTGDPPNRLSHETRTEPISAIGNDRNPSALAEGAKGAGLCH